MRVGYIGELWKLKNVNIFDITEQCMLGGVNLLVLAGGISTDYLKSLDIVDRLGKELEKYDIALRFIISNTDLYYSDGAVVNKEKKVRDIIKLYSGSNYYLPNRPILKRDIQIIAGQSHYDYSFYRGDAVELSKVTKKQKLWYKNKDNDYITSSDDYTMGLGNTFDYRFTHELNDSLLGRLHEINKQHGSQARIVVCTNVLPHKTFLGSGLLSGYKGTFTGNIRFHEIMKSCGVNECYFGAYSQKNYSKIDGVNYYCCSAESTEGMVEVVDYE